MVDGVSECAAQDDEFRAFRVAVGEDLAYWTVLDASLRRVADLDAFLFYVRAGRGRAEATTEAYARALAVFEGWRCGTGRDWLAAARDLHLFVATLRLSPIERQGRGFGGRRSNKRVNHVLAAVRSFYWFAVTAGRAPEAVLPLLWEVAETRHLPEELRPEGGGVQYRAQPRHQLRAERSVSPAAVTRQEAAALLGAAEHWRDRLLIVLLWHCGVRIGAALGLRRSDLHLMADATALGCAVRGPHLHVMPRDNPNGARAKTTAPFTVPVHSDVVAVYEMYLIERAAVPAAAECDFVFVNLFHQPLGAPMRYTTAHQLLAGLSRKADLDRRVTPHMFRHGTGRALAETGADIAVIKELLHHARFSSTSVYTRPSDERLRRAVDNIPPLRGATGLDTQR
jgi:site-specific recombinase XerD